MKTLQATQKIGFGKYRGTVVADLPESYKGWLRDVLGYNIEVHDRSFPFTSYVDHKLIAHIKEVESRPVNRNLPLTEIEQRLKEQSDLEVLHRNTCTDLGRKLIYENVQIPF